VKDEDTVVKNIRYDRTYVIGTYGIQPYTENENQKRIIAFFGNSKN
jgi:hypothetical protein